MHEEQALTSLALYEQTEDIEHVLDAINWCLTLPLHLERGENNEYSNVISQTS